MDIRFSETEMTEDGKTINVYAEDVISRVELFRPYDNKGRAGWSIIDVGNGEREVIENDLALAEARTKVMEYLIELEDKGENLYFAGQEEESVTSEEEEVGEAEEAGEGEDIDAPLDYQHPVDENGQRIMFPDASDYTDAQYDRAKEDLNRAKAALHDANKEKKLATEIAKMKEYDFHSRAVNFQIEETRIQSIRMPERAFVCINARGKLKTIHAAEIHTYPLLEISIYQSFWNGIPVDLEFAKSHDRDFLDGQQLSTIAGDDDQDSSKDESAPEEATEAPESGDIPTDVDAGTEAGEDVEGVEAGDAADDELPAFDSDDENAATAILDTCKEGAA